jgi:hypothetical protein
MEKKQANRKYYQIKMNPSAHNHLKMRARLMNLSIGQMVENLISSLEFRLKLAYRLALAQDKIGMIDEQLIRVILNADQNGLSESEIKKELREVARTTSTQNVSFSPTITV